MSTPTTTGSRAGAAVQVIGVFVVLLYVIELVDTILDNRLDGAGIEPQSVDGLDGILWAPVLHGGWWHLVGNTLPLAVLGFLILLSGVARWAAVTAIVWVVGGLGTWLVAEPGTIHLGASVLVFGWLVYLLLRGIFSRRPGQVALGVLVLVLYGGALWGVLPGEPGISWQGHLFGAIGGGLAAWIFGVQDRQQRRSPRRGIDPSRDML